MAGDHELERLRQDVQYLMDRIAILDCINTHARGCDLHDVELLTGTYHDDGVDEHGRAVTPGPEYAEFINGVHAATSQAHTHNITTHTCEIDGDVAHADSYALVALLGPDGSTAQLMSGRYIDRLERRDGVWRIAVRRATVELAVSADARLLQSRFFTEQGYPRGTRDRRDLSYERPLVLETEPPERW
jgi:ketosteroid isomerase-like protein